MWITLKRSFYLSLSSLSKSSFYQPQAESNFGVACCCCCCSSASEDHRLQKCAFLVFLIALQQIFEKKNVLDISIWENSNFFRKNLKNLKISKKLKIKKIQFFLKIKSKIQMPRFFYCWKKFIINFWKLKKTKKY